jgi:hypothetical protein
MRDLERDHVGRPSGYASPGGPSLSHPRCNQRVLCCNSDVPRGLQWPANVGVFGTRIECNQPHAVWALHLITGLETRGPFRKRFAEIEQRHLTLSVMTRMINAS